MRRLFIANTYYQLLFAMQLNNTVFKDDTCVMLLSDHSRNAGKIVEKLAAANIFAETHLLESREILSSNQNRLKRLKECINISLCKTNKYSCFVGQINNKFFDELLVFNSGIEIDGVYAELYKYNKKIEVAKFEEGILSYHDNPQFPRRKIINILRTLVAKNSMLYSMKYFYCYFPELYRGPLKPLNVPLIQNNSETAIQIKKIFDIDGEQGYRQKYIFFTSVYDFEGGEPAGEYELVCRIAEIVGKDNLLVKTHPRDTRSIYIDNGFNVDSNSSIPWEAIQLSFDFREKVLLTVASGGVLTGSFMSENPVTTFYMYKLCDLDRNKLAQETVENIESLLNDGLLKNALRNVHVAQRIEDVLSVD